MRRSLGVLATLAVLTVSFFGAAGARAQEDTSSTVERATTTTVRATSTTARVTTTSIERAPATSQPATATTAKPTATTKRTTTTTAAEATTSTSLATKDAENGINGGAVALLVVLIGAVGGVAAWVFTRMRSA